MADPKHIGTGNSATNLAKGALGATGDAASLAAKKLAAVTDMGPLSGFKKFISRGSMIDMAIGVVMGSAVTAVVTAVVNNLISPLIAAIGGKPNLDNALILTINGSDIKFGAILTALLNFLIVAAAVYFCIILPINKLRDMTSAATAAEEAAEEAAAGPTAEEQTLAVLQEIRDELKRANGTAQA